MIGRRSSRRAAEEKREATRKRMERDVEKENLQRLLSAYKGVLMNIKAEKEMSEERYRDLIPRDVSEVLIRAKKGPKREGIPIFEEVKIARGTIEEKLTKEKDPNKKVLLKKLDSVLKQIQEEEREHGQG